MFDNDVTDLTKPDADILFDIPDDALERVAAGPPGKP